MQTRRWKLGSQHGQFGQVVAAAMYGDPQRIDIDKDEAVIVMNARHYDLLREITKIDGEALVKALLSAPRCPAELEPYLLNMGDRDIETADE